MNRVRHHTFRSGNTLTWNEHWEIISFQTPAGFSTLVEYYADSQHVYIDGMQVEFEDIEFTLPVEAPV